MIVFKNYLKVAKSFLPIIIVYSCIFIGIAMITTKTNSSQTQFEASKACIAIINRDRDSGLIQSFQNYIEENAQYIELNDNEEELRDALFFRKVDYIMIIPEGFSESFLNGGHKKIETMEVPDAYDAIYSKNLMNKYLNTVSLYAQTGLDMKQIVEYVKDDLLIHTDVTLENKGQDSSFQSITAFFNFSNYTLISVIIVVVTMVMIAFQEEKVYKHHLIAPMSSKTFHFQLVLGNIVVSLGVWLLYVIASIVLYGQSMFTMNGLLYMINSLALVIFVLTFSVFLTTITHNRQLVSGMSTVAGLGTSFIAGAFVPQELLSPFVLGIAKFTPSYWFIQNNRLIARLSEFSFSTLAPLGMNFFIILGFALLFYIAMQIVNSRRMRNL